MKFFSALLVGGKDGSEGNVYHLNPKSYRFEPVCDKFFTYNEVKGLIMKKIKKMGTENFFL